MPITELPKVVTPHQTLVIVKPDGYKKGLLAALLMRLYIERLRVIEIHTLRLKRADVDRLYDKFQKEPFYEDLVQFMKSGPCFILRVGGWNAVHVVRGIIGTGVHPHPIGTFRGDYATSTRRNVVHASDSPKTARKELAWFFAGKWYMPTCSSKPGKTDNSRSRDKWYGPPLGK